jgi:hypothetical protein
MIVHVARDGKIIGLFETKEILDRLAKKQLLYTDHYWAEGMTEWRLLSTLIPAPPQRDTSQSSASGTGFIAGLFAGLFSADVAGSARRRSEDETNEIIANMDVGMDDSDSDGTIYNNDNDEIIGEAESDDSDAHHDHSDGDHDHDNDE